MVNPFFCVMFRNWTVLPLFHRLFFTFIYVQNYSIISNLLFSESKRSKQMLGVSVRTYHPLDVSAAVRFFPAKLLVCLLLGKRPCGGMTSQAQAGSLMSCKCNLAFFGL